MADLLVLDLVDKDLVTDQIVLTVGYDIDNLKDPALKKRVGGEVKTDRYGRSIPKHAHGTAILPQYTSSSRQIIQAVTELFDRIVDRKLLVRRISMAAGHVAGQHEARQETKYEQMDLFTDYAALDREREKQDAETKRAQKMQRAVREIKKKFGKNAILRGRNLEEGATARDRNSQSGGHRA